MKAIKKEGNGSGIGFVGLLTILFVGLKLTGYIGWSWWLVFAPTLVSVVILLFILLLVILFSQG